MTDEKTVLIARVAHLENQVRECQEREKILKTLLSDIVLITDRKHEFWDKAKDVLAKELE